MKKWSRCHKLIGLLAEMGITHTALAKELGVTGKTMSNKLNGHTRFFGKEIVQLCELLNIQNPREYFPMD